MRSHRQKPIRLLCLRDSPGKNSGVGCHFLLQCLNVRSESEVAQSCPTLSGPTDCSLPGSSNHGISQARVLEWGAIAFSAPKQWPFLKMPKGQPASGIQWVLNAWPLSYRTAGNTASTLAAFPTHSGLASAPWLHRRSSHWGHSPMALLGFHQPALPICAIATLACPLGGSSSGMEPRDSSFFFPQHLP